MISKIRKQRDNIIYTLIILGVAAVMGMYGIGKFGDEGSGSGGAVAWVNSDPIPREEYERALEFWVSQYRSFMGAQFDERFIAQFGIAKQALNELVDFKLMTQQAKKMGFAVSDEELASFIRKIPELQKNGRFDTERYLQLPDKGLLEFRQREALLQSRFRQYLTERVRLSPQAVKMDYALRETKVELEFAKLDLTSMAAKQKPTEGEIDIYMKSKPVSEWQAYYDSHRKEFTNPGTQEVYQIRIGVPFQASAAKKAEAKEKIDKIAKDLTAQNFETTAQKFSDDENAKKGGKLGAVKKGTLEASIEKALDELKDGEISKPIETAFGYYLVMAKNRKGETLEPFDTVKRKIAGKLLEEKKKKDFIAQKKEAWEKALAQGKPIDAELKAQKIEIKKTGKFSLASGNIPQVGNQEEILDAVFNLTKEKPIAPKLFENQEHFYYIKLASIEEPKPQDWEKNQAAVDQQLESSIQMSVFQTWMEALRKAATIKTNIKQESAEG